MNPNPNQDLLGQLATRLKEVRKFRGRTQENVAEQLQINYRHLQKIEGGKADFKLSTLGRLSGLLEIEPCFLTNTRTSHLFRTVSIPCQALMLDALPVGVLVTGEKGEPIFQNRRARELFAAIRSLNADGSRLASLLSELSVNGLRLSTETPSLAWDIEIPTGTEAPPLKVLVETRLQGAAAGRQVCFSLDCAEVAFRPEPINLARYQWDNFLSIPAKNIRSYRRDRKLTQTEAAEAMEMNLRYYQKVESGRLDLKCSTLAKIARTYEVAPCQLLVEEASRPACGGGYACSAGVLDRLPFGVVAVGSRGELAYANDAYFRQIGVKPNAEEQKHFWDIVPGPAEQEAAQKLLRRLFAERPLPFPLFREVPGADGNSRLLMNRWDYLISKTGKLLGGVGLSREIPAGPRSTLA